MEKTRKTKILIFFALAFAFFVALPGIAQAASLYFSPSSGSYVVGNTVSVGLFVSSADQALNAASGVITFPQDKLEVASLAKSGSIFSLWVQEPSFSNSAGTVNFEGITLNPGFTGAGGKLITINFRVKTAGTALLNFSSGLVLANDGKGTNILTSLGNANFVLEEAVLPPPKEKPFFPKVIKTPSAPQISSPTHPDPSKWYAKKDAKFTWNVMADATGARLLVDKNQDTIPTVAYVPAISEQEMTNIEDGVWYFHVRLQNSAGWGGTSHFRFQVDTEKPDHFDITEIKRDDPTDPRVKFAFNASDETSGIDHYEVQIDIGSQQVWQDDGSGIFETSVLDSGKHILIANAIDKAGNSLANFVKFTIEALKPPTITEYPRKLQSGEILIIKGSTYPNAIVILWLKREKEDARSYEVESNKDGNFTFIADEKSKDGIYKMWAEVVDVRGARSKPTEEATIVVERPAILRIGTKAITILAIIVPLVALIILLIALIWYSWHKLSSFRKKIRKENKEAEQALCKAINLLKEDIKEQIELLEKTKSERQLTEEEDKIIKQLKKDVDDAEKFVSKEIEDIENVK